MDKEPIFRRTPEPVQAEDVAMTSPSLPYSSPLNPTVPLPRLPLGPHVSVVTCPFCHNTVKTAVKFTTTSRTCIAAAACSFICCCCCIPLCSDSAKNTDHYCPSCYKYLGTYKK